MNYELLKISHILSVFIFLTATSLTFFLDDSKIKLLKGFKITCGISSFLIFFTGMGLMGVLKVGFPLWMMIKGLIWLAITAFGAMAAKRFPAHLKVPSYIILLFVGMLAIATVVYKPM
ncbi:hypothetical protein BVY03_02255 [bacterium K02(2017)]|nr:hypothetical protein BVY03_02255 [bacterium K02(2017)]